MLSVPGLSPHNVNTNSLLPQIKQHPKSFGPEILLLFNSFLGFLWKRNLSTLVSKYIKYQCHLQGRKNSNSRQSLFSRLNKGIKFLVKIKSWLFYVGLHVEPLCATFVDTMYWPLSMLTGC